MADVEALLRRFLQEEIAIPRSDSQPAVRSREWVLDKIKEASLRWADLDAMKTRLDTIETRASRIDYQGKDGKQIDPAQVARRKALYAYLRKGEAMMSELERKDLVIADDPDGGYLVHDELSTTIIEALSDSGERNRHHW